MAYESPIKIDHENEEMIRKVMNAEEAYIMYQVNLVVDVDKDELLKALQYDRDQYEKGYADGRRAMDAEIVRCKDCKHNPSNSDDDVCPFVAEDWHVKHFPEDYGFCKWGQRRDDGEIH